MHHITDGLKLFQFLFTNILQHINSRNISDQCLDPRCTPWCLFSSQAGSGRACSPAIAAFSPGKYKKEQIEKKQLKNRQTKDRQIKKRLFQAKTNKENKQTNKKNKAETSSSRNKKPDYKKIEKPLLLANIKKRKKSRSKSKHLLQGRTNLWAAYCWTTVPSLPLCQQG